MLYKTNSIQCIRCCIISSPLTPYPYPMPIFYYAYHELYYTYLSHDIACIVLVLIIIHASRPCMSTSLSIPVVVLTSALDNRIALGVQGCGRERTRTDIYSWHALAFAIGVPVDVEM